ncbi:MAG: methyl-accepting chemotaxis protein, partial [Myxococcales bacterium]|nr:methyl-accepting chemotaxis protein [Myxococcales bacterium]
MPSTTEEEVLNRIERYREGLLKVLSISSVVFCLVNVVTLWDVQRGGALWALGGVPPSLLAYVLVVRGRRRLSTYVLFYGVCGVIAGSMVYAAYPPLRGVGLQLMVLIATLFTFLEGHGPGAIYSACCIAGVFGGAMVDPELSGGYRFIVPSLEGATILLGWASAGFVARYGVDSERELKRRIQAMARIVVDAERIAQGDLTDDEMADRPPMVATMLEGLRGLVGRARESVSGLGAAMDQLQKTADETTAGASQQTAVVAETHRAIAELAQAAEVIEHASRDVLHNAQSTLDTNRLVEARIGVLAKHTERVAELLDLIRDVARRSEIIALNAALEGSRAG